MNHRLNMKVKTVKILEDNTEDNLYNLQKGKAFIIRYEKYNHKRKK